MDTTNLFHFLLFIFGAMTIVIVGFYHSYLSYCCPVCSRLPWIPLLVGILLWSLIGTRYWWIEHRYQSKPEPESIRVTKQIEQGSFWVLVLFCLLFWVILLGLLGKLVVATQRLTSAKHITLWDGIHHIPYLFSSCQPLRRASMDIMKFTAVTIPDSSYKYRAPKLSS